jgi:FeS assembly SUF system regulator
MIQMTKITDYGIILLSQMAVEDWGARFNSRDLAESTQLPLPMVSKILKILARKEILISHRGVKGGYSLSRPATQISLGQVISALEGPVAITECSQVDTSKCKHEHQCPVRPNWLKINQVVMRSLNDIPLTEMAESMAPARHVSQTAAPVNVSATPIGASITDD